MTSKKGFSQGEEERPGRAERERAWSSWRTRGGGRPCCKTGGKHWTSGERWDRLINYIPFLHLSISITEIRGLCWSPVNPEIPIQQWWDQWKTDLSLPQLQPSEGGKSPLKAATGNWGVIQTFKQIRRRTAQLSSWKKASLDFSDLTVKVSLWGTFYFSEGMVAPPPNYETHHNYPMIQEIVLGYVIVCWNKQSKTK